MARPNDPGCEYFPLDVDHASDDKFTAIEVEHGLLGYAVVMRLYAGIYRVGYCYRWSLAEQKLFSHRIRADLDLVQRVVETALNAGIFDRKMLEREGVLTSSGIQRRYVAIKKRKASQLIKAKYDLISEPAEIDENELCGDYAGVMRDSAGVMRDYAAQSKVKESKVNQKCVCVDDLKGDGENSENKKSTHTLSVDLEKLGANLNGIKRSLSKLGEGQDPIKKAAQEAFKRIFDFEKFDPENPNFACGKLPFKKFPLVWLSPTEFSELLADYRAAEIPDTEITAPVKKVQRRLEQWRIEGKKFESANAMLWLTGWAKQETIKDLIDRKRLKKTA